MSTRFRVLSFTAALFAVAVLTGTSCPITMPTPTDPAGFTSADVGRGGKLYDNWWATAGKTEPTPDHPLWASRPDTTSNTGTGSATWRCKECHGWDYKGVAGVYGSGSHKTGFNGIFGTTMTAQQVFDLLKNDAATTTNGHDYGGTTAGLADADIWDLAKFVLQGQIDTSTFINSSKSFFTGNATTGATLFTSGIAGGLGCVNCHGSDGKTINFKTPPAVEYVGTVANDNPWEFQHKVRFGQPNTQMPSAVMSGGTTQNVADVGAHAQTLPTS